MIQVMKFGGAAMASAETIKKVAHIIADQCVQANRCIVINSALFGMTDWLTRLCQESLEGRFDVGELSQLKEQHFTVIHELDLGAHADEVKKYCDSVFSKVSELLTSIMTLNELTERGRDQVITAGEYTASKILYAYLKKLGLHFRWIDPIDVIQVESQHGISFPNLELSKKLYEEHCKEDCHYISAGFIGRKQDGKLTTLGRGGSDLSATVFAYCSNASQVTLYKEVDGLMTADPKIVPEARIVHMMHYREAAELAYYGAKVLHPRTIIPIQKAEIPLRIANFNNPGRVGTVIRSDISPGEFPVKALTAIDSQSIISIEGNGMMGVPGIAGRTFNALANIGVSVSLISQASSESSICFTVASSDVHKAEWALNAAFEFELTKGLISKIFCRPERSIIALVGMGMGGTQGIASRAFKALAQADINIQAIAQGSTELNISLVIDSTKKHSALKALHREFRLEKFRSLSTAESGSISLAIYGFGQIAQTLLSQIMQQSPYFQEKLNIRSEVVGISDSSALVTANRPFNFEEIEDLIQYKRRGHKLSSVSGFVSNPSSKDGFSKEIFTQALHKGIFVDLTATDSSEMIEQALNARMHVVLANKKPLAIPIEKFTKLFEKSKSLNLQIRYEATVGAGLPVLDTLAKLHEVGDEIMEITGCFSGTLGYILSHVESGHDFSKSVRSAFANGYTEPDPRDDLSGVDVARKALILARTIGLKFNFEDISLSGLYDTSQNSDDPETFLNNLLSSDESWRSETAKAISSNKALRYVAKITPDRITVGIESIEKASPLGQLTGTDNLIQIRTRMYKDNPLILTGPGAGAAVTAAGVLNDIMSIATNSGK